jgi:zinc transporter ZupT
MPHSFWIALLTSLAAAAVTTLGIWTIRRFTVWGHRNIAYFMCFAAGVLISASFLHMIPKAFSLALNGPIFLLIGFFGMHLFNRFLTAFVCERDVRHKDYAIGVLPMIGIGFHSLIDGFIYSIAFTVDMLTGFLATVGMVLHEFPEGIVTYLLLVKSGFAERRAAALAFAAAAASTPVGMLVSWPVIHTVDQALLGMLLALSAGTLIYVGATHLLPRAEQEHRRYSLIALAGGIAVAVVIVISRG